MTSIAQRSHKHYANPQTASTELTHSAQEIKSESKRVKPFLGWLSCLLAVVLLAGCSPGETPGEGVSAGLPEQRPPEMTTAAVESAATTAAASTTTTSTTSDDFVADVGMLGGGGFSSPEGETTTTVSTIPRGHVYTPPELDRENESFSWGNLLRPPLRFQGRVVAEGVVERFVSVSVGWAYACGLLETREAVCWDWDPIEGVLEMRLRAGKRGKVSPKAAPAGVFTSVSASWGYACGLRPGGAVECWGENPVAELEPPAGVFKNVSARLEHVCGTRSSGKVECWGVAARLREVGAPPPGPFIDLTTNRHFSCGLRLGGEVECWGGGFNEGDEPPGGTFEQLAGGYYTCGLRSGGEGVCWTDSVQLSYGEDGWWGGYPIPRKPRYRNIQNPPPGVRFRMLSRRCGVDYDYKVLCWKNSEGGYEMLPTPEGEFIWVDYDLDQGCAIRRADLSLECWDRLTGEERPAPEGAFKEVWMSRRGTCWDWRAPTGYLKSFCDERDCALRVNGEVHCWVQPEWSPSPEGKFKTLSAFDSLLCGVRANGNLECWPGFVCIPDEPLECWPGYTGYGVPPGGEFTDVSTSSDHGCGLRPSGEIECWGPLSRSISRSSKIIPPEEEMITVDAGWGGLDWPEYYNAIPRHDATFWGDASGKGASCGLRSDGSAVCWGIVKPPFLGDHRYVPYDDHSYVLYPPSGEFVQIGVGRWHACGLRPGGLIDCWGIALYFRERRWGERRYTMGEDLSEDSRFTQLSVGGSQTCGLYGEGKVVCWSVERTFRPESRHEYERSVHEGPYVQVSAGLDREACAVRVDGGIDCWDRIGEVRLHIPYTGGSPPQTSP